MTPQITEIFKLTQYGEVKLGTIENNLIYSTRSASSEECGRIEVMDSGIPDTEITDTGSIHTKSMDTGARNIRIFRKTAHDEQELGYVTRNGEIISHGIFEGGTLGWMEEDGAVIQAGLILGEEEVGRASGPWATAGAAALLLHFLPVDAEEEKRMKRTQRH